MSDDKDQKTEEPTAKKLEKAHSNGDMAVSAEMKAWLILVVITFMIMFGMKWFTTSIFTILNSYMSNFIEITSDTTGVAVPLFTLMREVFLVLAVPFLIMIAAALYSNRMQNKSVMTLEKLKPDLKKLNPLSGVKKLFSMNNLIEFLRSMVKLILAVSVVFLVVWPERPKLDSMMFVPVMEALPLLYEMVLTIFITITILLTVIAFLDRAWQVYQFNKSQRMTKQEVKDERKQSDGDPAIKRRLAQIRRERFVKRLTSLIPQADVVITNPTHYAVALKYRHGEMAVPVLLAKGVDSIALRIRELATEHGIPIVENPPLARALHATVEVDDEIPPDHYRAVAEVISYLLKMKKLVKRPFSVG